MSRCFLQAMIEPSVRQVIPRRIGRLNELDLLRAQEHLDPFFVLDRLHRVSERFKVDEPIDSISRRECSVAMQVLINASFEVVRHADVEAP